MIICKSRRELRRRLKLIRAWGENNCITLNNLKSAIFQIKKRKSRNTHSEEISEIPILTNYKYLGIQVSNTLRLDEHIKELTKRANAFSNSIKKLKARNISLKTRMEIWKTFCKTSLMYGSEIFLFNEKELSKLDKIYLSTLKITCGLPKSTQTSSLLVFSEQYPLRLWIEYRFIKTFKAFKSHFTLEATPKSLIKIAEDLANKYQQTVQQICEAESDQTLELMKSQYVKSTQLTEIKTKTNFPSLFHVADLRDHIFIKFLCNRTMNGSKFLNKQLLKIACNACNSDVTQEHVVNHCPLFAKPRLELTCQLGTLGFLPAINSLYTFIKYVNYNDLLSPLSKKLKWKVLHCIKNFICDVYVLYNQTFIAS